MNIEPQQTITVQDALRVLADYRAAAGISAPQGPVAHAQAAAPVRQIDFSAPDVAPPPPRLGRFVNIWA